MNVFAPPWYPSTSSLTIPSQTPSSTHSESINNCNLLSNLLDTKIKDNGKIETREENHKAANVLVSSTSQIKQESEIINNSIDNNSQDNSTYLYCTANDDNVTNNSYNLNNEKNGIHVNSFSVPDKHLSKITRLTVTKNIKINTSHESNVQASVDEDISVENDNRTHSLHQTKQKNVKENTFCSVNDNKNYNSNIDYQVEPNGIARTEMTKNVNRTVFAPESEWQLHEPNEIASSLESHKNKIEYKELKFIHFDESSESDYDSTNSNSDDKTNYFTTQTSAYTSPQLLEKLTAQEQIVVKAVQVEEELKYEQEQEEEKQEETYKEYEQEEEEEKHQTLIDLQVDSSLTAHDEAQKKENVIHDTELCKGENVILENPLASNTLTNSQIDTDSYPSEMRQMERSSSNCSSKVTKSQEGASTSHSPDSLTMSTPNCYTHNPYSWMSSDILHSSINESNDYYDVTGSNSTSMFFRVADAEDGYTANNATKDNYHHHYHHYNSNNNNTHCVQVDVVPNYVASNFLKPERLSLENKFNLRAMCTENSATTVITNRDNTSNYSTSISNGVTSNTTPPVVVTLREIEEQLLKQSRAHCTQHINTIKSELYPNLKKEITDTTYMKIDNTYNIKEHDNEWRVESVDGRPNHTSSVSPLPINVLASETSLQTEQQQQQQQQQQQLQHILNQTSTPSLPHSRTTCVNMPQWLPLTLPNYSDNHTVLPERSGDTDTMSDSNTRNPLLHEHNTNIAHIMSECQSTVNKCKTGKYENITTNANINLPSQFKELSSAQTKCKSVTKRTTSKDNITLKDKFDNTMLSLPSPSESTKMPEKEVAEMSLIHHDQVKCDNELNHYKHNRQTINNLASEQRNKTTQLLQEKRLRSTVRTASIQEHDYRIASLLSNANRSTLTQVCKRTTPCRFERITHQVGIGDDRKVEQAALRRVSSGVINNNTTTTTTTTNSNNNNSGNIDDSSITELVTCTSSTSKRHTHRKNSYGWVVVEDNNCHANKKNSGQRRQPPLKTQKANTTNLITYVTKFNLPMTNKAKLQRSNGSNSNNITNNNNVNNKSKKNCKIVTSNTTTTTNNNSNSDTCCHINESAKEQRNDAAKEVENYESEKTTEAKKTYYKECEKLLSITNNTKDENDCEINTHTAKVEKKASFNSSTATFNDVKDNLNLKEDCIVSCTDNKLEANEEEQISINKDVLTADTINNCVEKSNEILEESLKCEEVKDNNGTNEESIPATKCNSASKENKIINNRKAGKTRTNKKKKQQQEQQQQRQPSLVKLARTKHTNYFHVMGIPIKYYTSIENVIEHDLRESLDNSDMHTLAKEEEEKRKEIPLSTSTKMNVCSNSNNINNTNMDANKYSNHKKRRENTRNIPSNVHSIASYIHRSHALEDSSNAKGLIIQRALNMLTEYTLKHFPRLVCVVLLEGSDCFADMERMLQCCQQAIELSEQYKLPVMQMLAKLSLTRTLARIIDITNAKEYLMDAIMLAIRLHETHTLSWIAMQMGVTRELSGHFGSSLKWYSLSEQLAIYTQQPRLLCDVHLCKAIACYAVGERALADEAYNAATELLSTFHPLWRIRPLQSYAQVKLQSGDLHAALALHREELELALQQNDLAQISRCMSSIALALKYLGCYEDAIHMYSKELIICNGYNMNVNNSSINNNNNNISNNNNVSNSSVDERQAVESLLGTSLCYMHRKNGIHKAKEFALRALKEAQRCNEYCTLAKALVQLADVMSYGCYVTYEIEVLPCQRQQEQEEQQQELNEIEQESSHTREVLMQNGVEYLLAAMTAMARVDVVERQQYLIKATLCELEWRCCGTFVRLIIHSHEHAHKNTNKNNSNNNDSTNSICNNINSTMYTNKYRNNSHCEELDIWKALLYSDVCNVPNTADIRGLLRRQRKRRGKKEVLQCNKEKEAQLSPNICKHSVNTVTTTTTTNNNNNNNNNNNVNNDSDNLHRGNPSLIIEHSAINNYFGLDLVTRHSIIALLKEPFMARRKLICYSLPWTEETLCVAFVVELSVIKKETCLKEQELQSYKCVERKSIIYKMKKTSANIEHYEPVLEEQEYSYEKQELLSLNSEKESVVKEYEQEEELQEEYELTITPFTLNLSSELVYLLVNSNALNKVFDSVNLSDVERDNNNNNNNKDDVINNNSFRGGQINYGDTPLWPQHYSKMAFDYEHSSNTTHQDSIRNIHTNPLYCLQVLYDSLLKPLEQTLISCYDGTEVLGLTFIGDGIFSRIPFHALHDKEHFLIEKYNITTCSSLALLETLYLTSHALNYNTSSNNSTFSRNQQENHYYTFSTGQQLSENNEESSMEQECPEELAPLCNTINLIDSLQNYNAEELVQTSEQSREHTSAINTESENVYRNYLKEVERWNIHHVTLQSTNNVIDNNNNNKNNNNKYKHKARENELTDKMLSNVKTSDALMIQENNLAIKETLDDGGRTTEALLIAEVEREIDKINATYRDKTLSNQLYSAVHDIQEHHDNNVAHVLDLHLPVVPETREDYCGYFTIEPLLELSSSSSLQLKEVIIAHSTDIATTWNLSAYYLVICSACGTYAGLSFHETGIPVYRALMYAGATRLLLPIGTRLSVNHHVRFAAIQAVGELFGNNRNKNNNNKNNNIIYNNIVNNNNSNNIDTSKDIKPHSNKKKTQIQCTLAQALQNVQCEMIKNGAPLQEWATYTLCGLP